MLKIKLKYLCIKMYMEISDTDGDGYLLLFSTFFAWRLFIPQHSKINYEKKK